MTEDNAAVKAAKQAWDKAAFDMLGNDVLSDGLPDSDQIESTDDLESWLDTASDQIDAAEEQLANAQAALEDALNARDSWIDAETEAAA